jgi:tripartite-type tricarboxylate transporter receptor subunit TctC
MSQPVIVENKAGAGGAIAADTVAKAPADGYTILLLPSGHASSAAMRRSLPYDALKDFSFVSTVTTYPMFVAVAAKSPIVSFNDLLQRAKASPGRLSYSSVGVGTGHHLLGEWINSEAKIELNHIPYKGAAPALTDILGGQVDVMLETATTVIPQQRAGKLRVLAVTSDAGKDLIPGTPAVSDSIPSVKYESWLGVALPAQTPRAIVNRLNAEIARAVQNPELQNKLAELGGRASPSTPEHFTKRVESDIAHFRRIVAARKIPLE